MNSRERSPSIEKTQVTWGQVELAVRYMKAKLEEQDRKFRYVYGVPRGGLAPAVMLSHLMEIPLIQDQPIIHVIDGPVVIVEDIVDTGKVLHEYDSYRKNGNMFMSIYVKPWSGIKPDWAVWTTEDWIVFPWEIE